jgi:hypothetical protein
MLLNIDADPGSVARRLAQPSKPNAQVWRYMSFARLVWLLSKKQLWFSRADLLDDRHEAMLGSAALGTGLTERPDQPSRDDWLAELKQLRSRLFVSCWHLFGARIACDVAGLLWSPRRGRNRGVLRCSQGFRRSIAYRVGEVRRATRCEQRTAEPAGANLRHLAEAPNVRLRTRDSYRALRWVVQRVAEAE